MIQWLMDHTEFLSNPVYIGGDSYSGVIVPAVMDEISKGIRAETNYIQMPLVKSSENSEVIIYAFMYMCIYIKYIYMACREGRH